MISGTELVHAIADAAGEAGAGCFSDWVQGLADNEIRVHRSGCEVLRWEGREQRSYHLEYLVEHILREARVPYNWEFGMSKRVYVPLYYREQAMSALRGQVRLEQHLVQERG
jgi:hypothetical protein